MGVKVHATIKEEPSIATLRAYGSNIPSDGVPGKNATVVKQQPSPTDVLSFYTGDETDGDIQMSTLKSWLDWEREAEDVCRRGRDMWYDSEESKKDLAGELIFAHRPGALLISTSRIPSTPDRHRDRPISSSVQRDLQAIGRASFRSTSTSSTVIPLRLETRDFPIRLTPSSSYPGDYGTEERLSADQVREDQLDEFNYLVRLLLRQGKHEPQNRLSVRIVFPNGEFTYA